MAKEEEEEEEQQEGDDDRPQGSPWPGVSIRDNRLVVYF
jgi:hypothetical protein